MRSLPNERPPPIARLATQKGNPLLEKPSVQARGLLTWRSARTPLRRNAAALDGKPEMLGAMQQRERKVARRLRALTRRNRPALPLPAAPKQVFAQAGEALSLARGRRGRRTPRLPSSIKMNQTGCAASSSAPAASVARARRVLTTAPDIRIPAQVEQAVSSGFHLGRGAHRQ